MQRYELAERERETERERERERDLTRRFASSMCLLGLPSEREGERVNSSILTFRTFKFMHIHAHMFIHIIFWSQGSQGSGRDRRREEPEEPWSAKNHGIPRFSPPGALEFQ